ncbi:MAG TPA: chemotaxis response regulator protein-glutamate methylesterase [Tepidiformaceae bacterium]|nr:chemotaxis response regulator protein-glutamate methylesterase [Tepidiformaceae bacterium]
MALPATAAAKPIRVLVVDDSAFMRRAVERILTAVPGITVVGTAENGLEAVRRSLELRPDVITMDVEMPQMDGVTAVGEIMQALPTPIVMVSTLTAAGTDTAIRALEAGAVDCVGKPSGLSVDLANVGAQLQQAVARASVARLQRRRPGLVASAHRPGATAVVPPSTGGRLPANNLLVIGSSTGGPPALTEVVPHIPGDVAAAVVIVQHMPPGFTNALARRLDSISPLHVVEAKEGDTLVNGQCYVAPGDYHLIVTKEKRLHLDQGPPIHGVRPSVDITLDSVVAVYGRSASVAILTGMGRDGADGAAKLEAAGGKVIAQDEASCVVYGMPRVTMERTQSARQVPLTGVAAALVATLSTQRGTR